MSTEIVNFAHHLQEHKLEISAELILVSMVNLQTLLVNVVTPILHQLM
jgi:hypothetical protein